MWGMFQGPGSEPGASQAKRPGQPRGAGGPLGPTALGLHGPRQPAGQETRVGLPQLRCCLRYGGQDAGRAVGARRAVPGAGLFSPPRPEAQPEA